MNINVIFFEDKLVDAIKSGVYGICIKTNNKEKLLYIGESVSALIRYAAYLYEMAKGEGYLGFTKEVVANDNIILTFRFLILEADKIKRKRKERN